MPLSPLPFPAKVLRFVGLEALRNPGPLEVPGAAELLAEQEGRCRHER
jgi:hypothetical protein